MRSALLSPGRVGSSLAAGVSEVGRTAEPSSIFRSWAARSKGATYCGDGSGRFERLHALTLKRSISNMEARNWKERPTPAAAYAAFLWQLTKVRQTFTVLTDEAFRARDLADVPAPAGDDLTKMMFAMFASAGRSMRNEISSSIRNNCAGAVLQIAWTLLDAHLDALGVPPKNRGNTTAGPVINGEGFADILWAARNGFAHYPEWSSQGGPRTTAGKRSVEILRRVGFADPRKFDPFTAFELLSEGNVELFISRLQMAAKEAANSAPTQTYGMSDGSSQTLLAVGLLLLLALKVSFGVQPNEEAVDGTFVFQIGKGEDAVVVPLAHGKCVSPIQFRAILEEAATNSLPDEDARTFREVESHTRLWFAAAEVLLATDPASPRIHRDLLAMCDQTDELYAMLLALPDPVNLLLKRRGCETLEQAQLIISEILETHEGFRSIPYREIKADILRQ